MTEKNVVGKNTVATFTIEKLHLEPILIVRELDTYNPTRHMSDLIDAVLANVENFERPGYGIFVMKPSGYSFNEIIEGARLIRDKGEQLRTHPKYRGTLFVSWIHSAQGDGQRGRSE